MSKKSVLTISITLASLLTSSTAGAINSEWWQGCKPYVGVDMQMRHMDFQDGYGDNLLSQHSPQRNLYAGLRLNDWIGAEIGYEATRTKTRNVTLHTGDIAAGVPVPAEASPAVFKSKLNKCVLDFQ